MSANLSFKFSQKAFRMDLVDHLGDTEALNRNFTLHFGQSDMGFGDSEMLGFH
jgi:hypothetical protein